MDIAFLLDKYFKGTNNVSIDVFDAQTLNAVYRNVVSAMTSHFEIEVSVLQALSYCLYEMMDNVHIHSGKPLGTAITYFDKSSKILRILIADDGMGIKASLAENKKYLIEKIGKMFILHSGSHKLMMKDGETTCVENGFWQGTLIYMEIGTTKEIDPNQVVDHRVDAAEEDNEAFVETEELESLW